MAIDTGSVAIKPQTGYVKMDIATGKTFNSFSELEAALEKLRKNGCHPLRVYNRLLKTITENDSVRRIPPVDPVDIEKFRYTYYSARCVHYGETRHRSKGLRPNQRSFSMGCQAKVTASYDR